MNESANVTRSWIRNLRRSLLDFFDERARDLPWRRTPDAYAIWISEVMLQQTRVETVIPYYERWMARFPTVDVLADASMDDVLRVWQGLGYYSRARNLHDAARAVRERHGGRMPDRAMELRGLPGVGEYTAGAVASIAYGRRQPAVDGNVRRVLHRLLDEGDMRSAELRSVAERLVPAKRPGDFNQALMELGATVCSPRSPDCRRCPITRLCASFAAGTQLIRPTPKRRARVPAFELGTAVVVAGDAVLVSRRPRDGLLGGLWEFPGRAVRAGESPRAAAARAAAACGVRVRTRSGRLLAAVPHAFSHRKETYHAFRFDLAAERPDPVGETGWRPIGELEAHAMPVAQSRIAWLLAMPVAASV
jgi:A/G-specific adenine glycosylase